MSIIAQAMVGVEVARATSRSEMRPPASPNELQAKVLYLANDVAALSTSAAELSPAASQLIRAAASLLITAGGQFRQDQNEPAAEWESNLIQLTR